MAAGVFARIDASAVQRVVLIGPGQGEAGNNRMQEQHEQFVAASASLLVTSASLLVTSALLLVTRSDY